MTVMPLVMDHPYLDMKGMDTGDMMVLLWTPLVSSSSRYGGLGFCGGEVSLFGCISMSVGGGHICMSR